MRRQPRADRLHRHVLARDSAFRDQGRTDGGIGPPVLRRVIQPQRAPFRQHHPARALDLQKERIGCGRQIEDRLGTTGEPRGFDIRARFIRLEHAVNDLPGQTFAAQHGAECLGIGSDQIGGTGIDGSRERVAFHPAALEFRLVIAGHLAIGLAALARDRRPEIGFKEGAGILGHSLQRSPAHALPGRRRAKIGKPFEAGRVRHDPRTAGAKGDEGGGQIVFGPAWNVGKGNFGQAHRRQRRFRRRTSALAAGRAWGERPYKDAAGHEPQRQCCQNKGAEAPGVLAPWKHGPRQSP